MLPPFQYVYPYRPLQSGTPSPCLPVELSVGTLSKEFRALVDTGAERTMFDGSLLVDAGLDLLSGPRALFHGFMGARTVGHLHRVKLTLAGRTLDIGVYFSTVPVDRPVLGRDVLEFFVVAFRERTMELHVAHEPLTA